MSDFKLANWAWQKNLDSDRGMQGTNHYQDREMDGQISEGLRDKTQTGVYRRKKIPQTEGCTDKKKMNGHWTMNLNS